MVVGTDRILGFGDFRSALFDAAVGGGPRKTYAYLDQMYLIERSDPLYAFLNHSDSEGEIPVEDQLALAARLEALVPKLADDPWFSYRAAALQFAQGLRKANSRGEPVVFH
jgi:hypothetical protein